MKRRIIPCLFVVIALLFPFGKLFAQEIVFIASPFSAGKASLTDDAYYVSRILGEANFSPELRYPVQLLYKSNEAETGLFGYAWECPQLESRAIPRKDGVEWKTPWGETVRFFTKQKADKNTLELYKEEMKGARDYFAPYANWEADGKDGDWAFTGKRNMKGWTFVYRNAQLTRITSPSNHSLQFNYVNNGQIKSISQDNNIFLECVYEKNVISEVKINGLRYTLSYTDCAVSVLPETLTMEPHTLKKTMLTSYCPGGLAPVEFAYEKGFLSNIKQSDFEDILSVETESFEDRISYLTEVAAYRDAKKDATKVKRKKVNGRLMQDSFFVYQYPGNTIGKVNLVNKLNEVARFDYDSERGIFGVAGFDGIQIKTYFYKRYDVAYNGDVRQVVDARDRVLVNYRYDKLSGKVTQIRDIASNEVYLSYDSQGNLSQIEKRAANEEKTSPVAKLTYDVNNNPIGIMPLNADGSIALTVRQSFNKQNQLTARTDGQSHIRYAYNDFGYIREIADQFNRSRTFHYDSYNRLSSIVNPNGVEVVYIYNDAGLLTQLNSYSTITSKKLLRSVAISYNERGLPVAYTDHKGKTTRYERDAFGRVLSTLFADKTENQYVYDPLGRMIKVIDSNRNEIDFSWDKFGPSSRMTAEKQVLSYTYNQYGLLQNTVAGFRVGDPARSMDYRYDAYDRIASVTYDKNDKVFYTYDAWGKIIAKTMDDGKQIRALVLDYDYFGRLAKSVETLKENGKHLETLETRYTYNAWGQRIARQTVTTTPSISERLTASWKYDQYGRLIQSREGGNTVSYLYNAHNQVARRTVNGSDTFYTYTSLGYLDTKQFGGSMGGENPDALLKYVYDADGTLVGREFNGERLAYHYDAKGQLIAVINAKGEKAEQYHYDPAGNILSKTVDGKTTTFTYDKANQLVSKTDPDGILIHYTYDGAGRLTKEGKTEYAYAWLDKVMVVSENGHMAKTYDYYVGGQLSQVNDLTENKQERFLWDGLALIKRDSMEYLNDIALTGGNPIVAGNKILFDDMLGNSIGIKDGQSITAIRRDAFGNILGSNTLNSPMADGNMEDSVPITLNGKELNDYDFFTGKPNVEGLGYNFVYRNYRSELGKWQTHDPKGYPDGWNNLAYCNNWTTTAIDPWGTDIYHLVAPSAVNGNGHSGWIIGDDKNGYTTYDYGKKSGASTDYKSKSFTALDDAVEYLNKDRKEGEEFTQAQMKETTPEQDKKGKTAIEQFIEEDYDAYSHNCYQAGVAAAKAMGQRIDESTPQPNAQFKNNSTKSWKNVSKQIFE